MDHGLRPESADEAAMVAEVCAGLGIPHETLGVTVAPGNLQDRARAARYAALAMWCGRRGLAALATGHQRDDQAETLLMRLNRGSGLAGLAGVRARGKVLGTDLPLLRPLLGWPRAELADVVAAARLQPALDPSNENDRFERVRMRRALAAADWLDPEALARSAALLAEAECFIAETIAELAGRSVRRLDNGFALRPPASDFAATELCVVLIAELGGSVSRSDATGLVARLRRGENASLAGVLARLAGDDWIFAPEPPRSGL